MFNFDLDYKYTLNIQKYQCCGSGIPWFYDPWIRYPGSGRGKNPKTGSGIRDEHSGSYFLWPYTSFLGKNIWILWCGCGSGSRILLTLDLLSGMDKIGSGILDQDKHPGSETLRGTLYFCWGKMRPELNGNRTFLTVMFTNRLNWPVMK